MPFVIYFYCRQLVVAVMSLVPGLLLVFRSMGMVVGVCNVLVRVRVNGLK